MLAPRLTIRGESHASTGSSSHFVSESSTTDCGPDFVHTYLQTTVAGIESITESQCSVGAGNSCGKKREGSTGEGRRRTKGERIKEERRGGGGHKNMKYRTK